MDDPDFICESEGVNNPKRIAPKRERDLKDAGTEAMQRFRDVDLAAFGPRS